MISNSVGVNFTNVFRARFSRRISYERLFSSSVLHCVQKTRAKNVGEIDPKWKNKFAQRENVNLSHTLLIRSSIKFVNIKIPRLFTTERFMDLDRLNFLMVIRF
jgi:hypothetical protein